MTAFEKRIVVKLGGSLLTQPDLHDRLIKWLATKSKSIQFIFIVGGGPTVEGLRQIDVSNPIKQEVSHWVAIKLMDANALLLSNWFPAWPVIDDFKQLSTCQNQIVILHVNNFLREYESNLAGQKLPIGWQTTSDAIAARLAECLEAELVLLKSITVAEPYDWEMLREEGIVDPILANMADKPAISIETLPTLN